MASITSRPNLRTTPRQDLCKLVRFDLPVDALPVPKLPVRFAALLKCVVDLFRIHPNPLEGLS